MVWHFVRHSVHSIGHKECQGRKNCMWYVGCEMDKWMELAQNRVTSWDFVLTELNLAFCRHRVGTIVKMKMADSGCLQHTRRILSALEGQSEFLGKLMSQKWSKGCPSLKHPKITTTTFLKYINLKTSLCSNTNCDSTGFYATHQPAMW